MELLAFCVLGMDRLTSCDRPSMRAQTLRSRKTSASPVWNASENPNTLPSNLWTR